MRVVYKNKYKAIRGLWRLLDILTGIGKMIVIVTLLSGAIMCFFDDIIAIAILSAGALLWSLYSISTAVWVNKVREHINMLQSREDTVVSSARLALYVLDKKRGKCTLGVNVDGRTYRLVAGEDIAPITIDCITGVATISKGIAWLLKNGRTN